MDANSPKFTRRKVDVPPLIAFKWSAPVVDEGFLPFPKRLLRCLSQIIDDVRDIQVILAIVDYSRPNLTRPPSYEFLAFNAGMEVQEVKDRVERMRQRGWLTYSGIDDAIDIEIGGLLGAH